MGEPNMTYKLSTVMEVSNIFGKDETSLSVSKQSILVFLSLLIFTLFLFKRLIKFSSSHVRNLPPSPPKFPIIGNLHQLGSIPHVGLQSLAQKYGSIMLLHLGNKPTLIISSSDAAEMVLKTHDLTFASRPRFCIADKLGYDSRGVGTAPYGEYWRQVRSICVLHLLSNKMIQSFRRVREEEVATMVEKVEASCSSPSSDGIEIRKILATLTNNIVSRVSIGRRYSGEKSGSNFKEIFEELTKYLGVFNVRDYIPWLGWVNHITGLEANLTRVAKKVDEYFENIVEEGIRRQEIKNVESEEEKGQKNFLSVLLQLQRENETTGFALHRDSIKALILDMFVGGTDSTSTLLEWTLAELMKNTETMIKLQNELREFSGHEMNSIKEEDLEKLPYLKAVIKETLRMHPPIPMLVPHQAREDIKFMGYDIAAGTQVIINAFAIGRDSRVWENANEFQPERFLDSPVDVKGQHFELLPFSSGRRSCPGYGFALVTIELALANLVLKFNFKLAGEAKPEDLDMIEAPAIVTKRKTPLVLVASLPS